MSSDSHYRSTPYGEEMRCPECGAWATADYVDNGVEMQRCGPYSCDACGWVEPRNDLSLLGGFELEEKS